MKKLFIIGALLLASPAFAQQVSQRQIPCPGTLSAPSDTVIAGGSVQRVVTCTVTQIFTAAQYQALLANEQTNLTTMTNTINAMAPIAAQAASAGAR